MEIDFDKSGTLRRKYYKYLNEYNAYNNRKTKLYKELNYFLKEYILQENHTLQDYNKSISTIKSEIIGIKMMLIHYSQILTSLKRQIKEAEREFNDYVNSFYIDFENHYGQPYKSYTCSFPHNSLKNQMKYFYYTVKQINKQ